jgi:hypothetical protein
MRSNFFSLIALLAVAAHAEDLDLEKAVGSLIAAEKAYAKLDDEKDFATSQITFLTALAKLNRPTNLDSLRLRDRL